MTNRRVLLIALLLVGIALLVAGGFYLIRPLSFRPHYGFIAAEHGEEVTLYLAPQTASWLTPISDVSIVGVNPDMVEVLSAEFVRKTRARPYALELKLKFVGQSGETVIIEGLEVRGQTHAIGSVKLLGVDWSEASGVLVGYEGGFAQATSTQQLYVHLGLQGEDCVLTGCYPELEVASEVVLDPGDPQGTFVLTIDEAYLQEHAVLIWRPALEVKRGSEVLTVPGPLEHFYLADK